MAYLAGYSKRLHGITYSVRIFQEIQCIYSVHYNNFYLYFKFRFMKRKSRSQYVRFGLHVFQ